MSGIEKNYYIYSPKMLAVQTNATDFSWEYGTEMPKPVSRDEYEKCKIKVNLSVVSDSEIKCEDAIDSFQSFHYLQNGTIVYKRNILGIDIAFSLKIEKGIVEASFGKHYHKYIKGRYMNLHSEFNILSDIVCMMFLQEGVLPLYCSSVYDKSIDGAIVIFSPPNTGKTLSAYDLCEKKSMDLITEDVALTDGNTIWSCPYTGSQRVNNKRKGSKLDSSGSLGRSKKKKRVGTLRDTAEIKQIALLKKGNSLNSESYELKGEIKRKVNILNGYLFQYCCSPAIKVLGYFNSEYEKNYSDIIYSLTQKLLEGKQISAITCSEPQQYADKILQMSIKV